MSEGLASSDRIVKGEGETDLEDIEMQDRKFSRAQNNDMNDKGNDGIVVLVKTDVKIENERSRDDERDKLKRDSVDPLRKPPATTSCRADNVWRE